jgi:hypothetical protein
VRLEDNRPAGTRFVIDFNTPSAPEPESSAVTEEISTATLKM